MEIFHSKNTKSGRGFTLVEMLVTMFIFSLVFAAISSLFISAIQNQSRALAGQQLLSQTSYVMEYMGRAIRMAQKDLDGMTCSIPAKSNYATTSTAGGGIKFKNYLGQCQEFFRDCTGGPCKLKETKVANTSDLTSSNLDVLSFNIGALGWDQTDQLQPRVTISLEVKKAGQGPQPKIKVQTTISQRRIDVSE